MSDTPLRLLFTPEECRTYRRCLGCGWHPRMQGHHPDCPSRKVDR